MVEFTWGDRVRLRSDLGQLGTVLNDQVLHKNTIQGSFQDNLPLPVVVSWDKFGVFWESNEDLELA